MIQDTRDTHGKYIRLFGTLFFTFIGFIIALILLLLILRVTFGILSFIPWITYIFTLFIICVPASILVPAFLIYIKRTKTHPSAAARVVSYVFFAAALGAWAYVLVMDMILFFKHYYTTVGEYMSFNMAFLAANVLCLFLIAMVQGLSVKKEEDWMEKRRRRGEL